MKNALASTFARVLLVALVTAPGSINQAVSWDGLRVEGRALGEFLEAASDSGSDSPTDQKKRRE